MVEILRHCIFVKIWHHLGHISPHQLKCCMWMSFNWTTVIDAEKVLVEIFSEARQLTWYQFNVQQKILLFFKNREQLAWLVNI